MHDAAESAAPGELGRDLIAAADIPRSEATRACAATPSMACVAIGDGSSSAASAADSGVDCAFLVARAAANWAFLDACDLFRCAALPGLAAAVFFWPDFGAIGRHGLSRNAAKKFQPRRNHLNPSTCRKLRFRRRAIRKFKRQHPLKKTQEGVLCPLY